jgi:hypothetical protein
MLFRENPAVSLSNLWDRDPSIIPADAHEFDAISAHISAI